MCKIINGALTYTSAPASLPQAAASSKLDASVGVRAGAGAVAGVGVSAGAGAFSEAACGSVEIRLGTLARVQGNVKVVVSNSWGKVCALWFHTSFLQEQGHVVFWKKGLDGPVKDKKHKVFPANFAGA